jgi:hypothetical protein
MTYEYKRTVAAAVAETQSKFALAEALASDIPPKRPGPGPEMTVTEHLILAHMEIKRAGGEARSVETLDRYRKVAIWVRAGSGPNYRWIPGISFTTHREAFDAGLSYEQFAADPKRPARRPDTAKKAEAARKLLDDPEVVKQVINDPATRTTVRKALDEAYAGAPKPYADHTDKQPHDHEVEVLVRLRAISAAIKTATDVIQAGPPLGATTEDLAAVIDWQLNALSILRAVVAGRSDMDAELAKILENGA